MAGSLPSKPADAVAEPVPQTEKEWNERCDRMFDAYEDCVKSHRLGLRSDEDCKPEADSYKNCRKQFKEFKQAANTATAKR